jgi:HD-GYP domain-containing protein (c-di-GMP phosphodiesterase class II)
MKIYPSHGALEHARCRKAGMAGRMKKEVKTSVNGLDIGMFVSRLDQPWIKTPFALEGIQITSREDIENIRKYCNYVYVDIEQGSSPDPRHWILTEEPRTQLFGKPRNIESEAVREKQRAEYAALRKTTYQTTARLNDEVKVARNVSEKITADYKTLLADLERNRDLDIHAVESGISDMVESVIRNPSAMMWIVHLKKMDEYTYSRALGTSVWCATFGRHLGLDKDSINILATGGLLLDLGKSRLPQELLKKVGSLSEEEMNCMHKHVDLGVKLLANNASSKKLDIDIMQMVASHHERADGTGYPQGVTDGNIPLYGKIAGIVDSYDAMTSERPFLATPPRPPHDAIAELYQMRGSKFQAELVEQFIQTVGLYPTGSLVELTSGEVGVVVAINGLRRLRPTVMLLLDENKEPYQVFKHLNLSRMDGEVEVTSGLPPGAYGINMDELFI